MTHTLSLTRYNPMDGITATSIAAAGATVGVAIVGAIGGIVGIIKKQRILDATTIEAKKIDAGQSQMDRMEREIKSLTERYERLQDDHDIERRLRIELQDKVATAEREISKLRDEAKVRQIGYEEDVTRLQDENIMLRNRVANLLAENAALVRENTMLKGAV